jgi:hypothetical protein
MLSIKRGTDTSTAVSVSFIARVSLKLKHGTGTAVSVSFIARNYFCSGKIDSGHVINCQSILF